MSIYRVLRPLQTDRGIIATGDFILDTAYKPATLAILEERGAIGLLHAPPLSEIPDFGGAVALADIGIFEADKFLEADSDTIIQQLHITQETLHDWIFDVSDWLALPPRRQ